MGGGQAVRHGPLEPAFVGSNPTRPVFFSIQMVVDNLSSRMIHPGFCITTIVSPLG